MDIDRFREVQSQVTLAEILRRRNARAPPAAAGAAAAAAAASRNRAAREAASSALRSNRSRYKDLRRDTTKSLRVGMVWRKYAYYSFPDETALITYKWPQPKVPVPSKPSPEKDEKKGDGEEKEETKEKEKPKGKKEALNEKRGQFMPLEMLDTHHHASGLAANKYLIYPSEAEQFEQCFNDPPYG